MTREFVLKEHPKGIINIVDATNIERNLYLTMQLMELDVPMVLALNMMDEVRSNGGTIDIPRMEEALGIPVVAISAAKNEGIEDLIHAVREVAEKRIWRHCGPSHCPAPSPQCCAPSDPVHFLIGSACQ